VPLLTTRPAPRRSSTARPRPHPVRAGNLLQAPAPGRVLLVGASTAPLGGAVTALDDVGVGLVCHDRHGPRLPDAVVLGREVPRELARRLSAEASAAGVPLRRLGREPVVDVREVNPNGWRRSTTAEIGLLVRHPDRQRTWAAVDEAAARLGSDRVVLLLPSPWSRIDARGLTVRRLPDDARERGAVLHALRAVVDLADLHVAVPERAGWIVEVAARGVPVVADDLDRLRGWVHEPLLDAVAGVQLEEVADEQRREVVSVDQRRAAVRHHGAPQIWAELARSAGLPTPPVPTVSVLLATNRADQVEAAVARIERQRYPRLEVVVALHGDGFPRDVEQRLRRRTERPLELVRVPADRPLGDVLNLATNAASGQLVTKMDDDDLYDAGHVDDLIDGLRTSGATVVGKGSEYVYLEELDTTIRRFPHGAESTNRNVAGGTLLLGRDDLLHVGGWQRVPRAVDQRLIDDVERVGGRLHRTHGRGFVLYRRGEGHTWRMTVDYFLQQAVRQWRGLALDQAGVA
jgi:hypothetical protein